MAGLHTRCTDCGASWQASARYCGACGQVLPLPADPAEPPGEPQAGHGASRRGRRRRRTQRVGALLALSLVATLGALVWLVVGGPAGDRAPGHPGIDLPDGAPLAANFQRPEVSCEPAACVRWSLEVGHGTTSVYDHGIYHATRDGLLAIEPDGGAIRWHVPLSRPGLRLVGVDGRGDGTDRLVLLVDHDTLRTWDATTGQPRWEAPWPGASRVIRADLVGGHLLIAASGALPDPAADDPLDTVPAESGVVALDPATGARLWTRQVDQVVALSPMPLVFADDSLVAVEPATGDPRWRRPAVAATFDQSSGEVAAAAPAGVTFLDASTGVVRDQLALDLEQVLADRPARHPRYRLALYEGVLGVASARADESGRRVAGEWELDIYDRDRGSHLARYDRAVAWWRAGGRFLVSFRDDDQGRLAAVDARTGEELARYGGPGWEALDDGLLASGSTVPVVGGINVTRLAGPAGSVSFSRQVRVVATDPAIVAYWDRLFRVDEQLLFGTSPAGEALADPLRRGQQ